MATFPSSTNAADAPLGRWARWVRFLDQREPGTCLALFRIAIGLVILGTVGSVVLHGLVPSLWMSREHGGFLAHVHENWLIKLLGGASPRLVWSLTFFTLACGALLALGLGGRLTAFLTLQAYMALLALNPVSHGSDDRLLGNALWLLVLGRSTATLSLDSRLLTGAWRNSAPVSAWPRYLIIYQLVLVYCATGVQKVSEQWVPGGELSALYYIMQQPAWVRWDMSWLAWIFPLTQVATLIAWLFEVFAPLLLLAFYFRNTADRPGRLRAFFNWINYRRLFVIVGVTMHVCLIVFLNVEPFSWVTLSFYICLFRPEEWQALGKKIFGPRSAEMTPVGAAPPLRAWWPPVRAILITLHLAAVTLASIPAPPESVFSPQTWQIPAVREEVVHWSERLNRWGIATTPDELQRFAVDVSGAWIQAYNVVTAPFQPYYTYCGAEQGWCMFSAADSEPPRLHVDVKEADQWRTIAVAGDPKHAWLAAWLGHHRIRPALAHFPEDAAGFTPFAAWIAEQARADSPDAQAVRVYYCRRRTPPPEDVRAGRWPPPRCDLSEIVWLK